MTSLTDRDCDRVAVWTVAAFAIALLGTSLVWHRTPLYGVETDLLGDSIPAAQAIRSGRIGPDTFLFRGPGFPLLLAGASLATGGDHLLAAKLVNVAATLVAAACAYLMTRGFLGAPVGLGVLLALIANPVFLRAAIEAGTDMPALALSLGATCLVLRGGGPRSLGVAGFLAGVAFVTRYNTVFLVPAAVGALVDAPGRRRRLIAYAAGLAIPLGAWAALQAGVLGAPLRNQNYLNVAYEVYGRGMGWARFWLDSGSQFGSFLDVVAFDPLRFASHVGRNLATRWLTDARELMPVWVGALAVPGMVVAWRHRPGWPRWAGHFGFCYLVLTLVFYAPRFFLYLLPFYLSGAVGLLLHPGRAAAASGTGTSAVGRAWPGRLGPTIAAVLIAASAVAAVAQVRGQLRQAPDETRIGGEVLRDLGRPGERVMARKPHVAHFAGMQYAPLPYVESVADLFAAAERAGARYLFISPIESGLFAQLAVLVDSGVSLPGLEQLAHRVLGEGRYFALYRFGPGRPSEVQLRDSLLSAIRRFRARRPAEGWPHTYLGGHLVTMGRYREALTPLSEGERLAPQDPLVARFQAVAHGELGEYEQAAAACERALRLTAAGTWERAYLGHIRLEQGRYDEAREHLRRAVRDAPANTKYLLEYARACYLGGDLGAAAAAYEKLLRAEPADAAARLYAARAWLRLGREERARGLLSWSGRTSGPDSAVLAALAESLRVAPRVAR